MAIASHDGQIATFVDKESFSVKRTYNSPIATIFPRSFVLKIFC